MGLFSKKHNDAKTPSTPTKPALAMPTSPGQDSTSTRATPLYERFARTSSFASSGLEDGYAFPRSQSMVGDFNRPPWMSTYGESSSSVHLSDPGHIRAERERARVPSGSSRFAGGTLNKELDVLGEAAKERFLAASSSSGAGRRSHSEHSTRPTLAVLTATPKVLLPSPPTPPDDDLPPPLPLKTNGPTKIKARIVAVTRSPAVVPQAPPKPELPAKKTSEDDWEVVQSPTVQEEARNQSSEEKKQRSLDSVNGSRLLGNIGLLRSKQSEPALDKPARPRIKLDTPPEGAQVVPPAVIPASRPIPDEPDDGPVTLASIPIQLPSAVSPSTSRPSGTPPRIYSHESAGPFSHATLMNRPATPESPSGRKASAAVFRSVRSPPALPTTAPVINILPTTPSATPTPAQEDPLPPPPTPPADEKLRTVYGPTPVHVSGSAAARPVVLGMSGSALELEMSREQRQQQSVEGSTAGRKDRERERDRPALPAFVAPSKSQPGTLRPSGGGSGSGSGFNSASSTSTAVSSFGTTAADKDAKGHAQRPSFELPPGAAPPFAQVVQPAVVDVDHELPADLAEYAATASLLSLSLAGHDDAGAADASSSSLALPGGVSGTLFHSTPSSTVSHVSLPQSPPQSPPEAPRPALNGAGGGSARGNSSFVFVRGAKLEAAPDKGQDPFTSGVAKVGRRRSQLFDEQGRTTLFDPPSASASTSTLSHSNEKKDGKPNAPSAFASLGFSLGRGRSATVGDADQDSKPAEAVAAPLKRSESTSTRRLSKRLSKAPPPPSPVVETPAEQPKPRKPSLLRKDPAPKPLSSPKQAEVALPPPPPPPVTTSPIATPGKRDLAQFAASLQPQTPTKRPSPPLPSVVLTPSPPPPPPEPTPQARAGPSLAPKSPQRSHTPPAVIALSRSPPSPVLSPTRTPPPHGRHANSSYRLSSSSSHDALSSLGSASALASQWAPPSAGVPIAASASHPSFNNNSTPGSGSSSLPTSMSHPALSSLGSPTSPTSRGGPGGDPAAFLAKMRTTSPAVSGAGGARKRSPPVPSGAQWDPPRLNAANRNSSGESLSGSPFFKTAQIAPGEYSAPAGAHTRPSSYYGAGAGAGSGGEDSPTSTVGRRTGGAAPRALRSAGPSVEDFHARHGNGGRSPGSSPPSTQSRFRDRSSSTPARPGLPLTAPSRRSALASSSMRAPSPTRPWTYRAPGLFPIIQHVRRPELLDGLLRFLDWEDWRAVWNASKSVRAAVETKEGKEVLLERFLGYTGYRRWTWRVAEPLPLSIQDLNAYMLGALTPHDMHITHAAVACRTNPPTRTPAVSALAASARAYSRVIIRLRQQAEAVAASSNVGMNGFSMNGRPTSVISTASGIAGGSSHGFKSTFFRLGHAPLLKVYVPSPEGIWLSDESVLACENEIKRSGVVQFLRPGDVVWDCALGSEGNVGRLIWDGGYLIDLDYTYSPGGDVPTYIHSLSLPPAYFHKVIRTGPNPLVHADLMPWANEILAQVQLMQDRHPTDMPTTPEGAVGRWVHRSRCRVRGREPIVGVQGLTVDSGWTGTLIIEAEGTNEGMAELRERLGVPPPGTKRRSSQVGPPKERARTWRLLRDRSRPGEIWLRAITDKDRLQ